MAEQSPTHPQPVIFVDLSIFYMHYVKPVLEMIEQSDQTSVTSDIGRLFDFLHALC